MFQIPALTLFEDPEGLDFTYYYRAEGFQYPPYFLETNYDNDTIYGTPLIIDVATHKLELVGVDNAGQETAIKFDLFIQRKPFPLAHFF